MNDDLRTSLRIIDASANRAREALRVLEDIARFGREDRALSERLKQLRHDLAAAVESLPFSRDQLLRARDVANDPGTTITTESELRRETLRGIAAAASARLSESLRSLEEHAKRFSPAAAQRFEQSRYAAYEADKTLAAVLTRGSAPQWRLCLLLTESLCTAAPWDTTTALALSAGADALQLREKSLPDAELLRRAQRLRALTREHGAALVINDRPDIALLCGADAVHLGQDDLPIAAARGIVGDSIRIGVSTENLSQALAAVEQGADMCGLGPMFPTTTKDKPRLAGPGYLREYLAHPALGLVPHLAIGGINAENVNALALAGCEGIAVSSAVCSAPDPAEATRALLAALRISP